jgi:hypothetical protein
MMLSRTSRSPRRRHQRSAGFAPTRSIPTLLGVLALFTGAGCGGDGDPASITNPDPTGIPPCETGLINSEFLNNLSESSVALSVFPEQDVELFVEYGPAGEPLSRRTRARIVAADDPGVFRLEDLQPGTAYHYRVRCRNESGEFGARPEFRFRTLPPSGAVTFAFATDSHIFSFWAQAMCGTYPDNLESSTRTLDNILAAGVDFLIIGGDSAMTQCNRCIPCRSRGEDTGTGSVRTGRQAELRYRVARNFYERVAHSIPVFQVLGNHDGEAGFLLEACDQNEQVRTHSLAARKKYLPIMAHRLGGGPDGNYLAFEVGDALIVILDVMRYTRSAPQTAADWSLGTAQTQWLEDTLESSGKTWKFIFQEHLVGGTAISEFHGRCDYHYGRGGLRATDTGETTGTFLGEQAAIHAMMKTHGAQFVFYGHDHVFSFGEKRDVQGRGEGIYYVTGGRTGVREARFSRGRDFRRLYDFDGDGKPDIRREPGFTRVTVHGRDGVTIQYIETDHTDPENNGRVAFETRVEPPAPPGTSPGPDGTAGPATVNSTGSIRD